MDHHKIQLNLIKSIIMEATASDFWYDFTCLCDPLPVASCRSSLIHFADIGVAPLPSTGSCRRPLASGVTSLGEATRIQTKCIKLDLGIWKGIRLKPL